MGVIRSRPRIAQGLASLRADDKADVQQVRRMVQAIPKPEPAVAGEGGAQGYTRAEPGLVTNNTGSKVYTFADWTFDSTWSNFGWTDPTLPPQLVTVSQISTTDQVFGNRDAGWFYQRVYFSTDSTATKLTVSVNRASTSGGIEQSSYSTENTFLPGVGGSYSETFFIGPFWLPANVPADNRGPFRFEAAYPPAESPTHLYFEVEMDIIAKP